MIGVPKSRKLQQKLFASAKAALGEKADRYKAMARECGRIVFEEGQGKDLPWTEIEHTLTYLALELAKREEGIVDTNPRTCPDPVYTSEVIYWFALWAEFGYKEAMGDEAAKRRQAKEEDCKQAGR